MSESAGPAADTLEVEESETQRGEQPNEESREDDRELSKQSGQVEPAAVQEVEDEKAQEGVEEPKEQQEKKLEPQRGELQNQEEEQEVDEEQAKLLEESQDTMQLPAANTSEKRIDDEEMPSMVTISSPSRLDESEVNMKHDKDNRSTDAEESDPKSIPAKAEDNDSDSVCVIDDDDDEDDGDRSSFDEDESSSYHEDDDSEEMYRHRNNDNYDRRHVTNVRTEDEDEEEEEDEVEEEDYADDDSEPDRFDGGSDDLVLRYSNGLTRLQKERSASLQDLSLIKGTSTKSRHNVNPFSQKSKMERGQINVERRVPVKQYAHVQSKVKKYIMNMAQQRRMSGERRKKAQEEARQRNQDNSEVQIRRNEEVAMTCKTIKDYTEKTLKEVAECDENEEMYDMPQFVENGEISVYPRNSMGNGEQMLRQEEMDVDPIEVKSHKNDERTDKINGAAVNERKGIHRREQYPSKPVLNGEDPTNSVCNLQALTYEEYMKGSMNKELNEVNEANIVEELQPVMEKCNNNDTEPTCILRIENVTSNYCAQENIDDNFHDRKTPLMMINQSTETYYQENPEVISLRLQLDQRNSQFENLRDVYQKTMSENLSMKMELDNLKKMLFQYQQQQKPMSHCKTTAVQTECFIQPPSIPMIEDTDNEQQSNLKLPTVSMISQVSTQWSDSTGSAAISMEPPPNVTNVLDDSVSQPSKTPLKQKNMLSRAFITSSRILQTLSSITHGKSKTDKYESRYSKMTVDEPIAEASTSAQSEKVQFVKQTPSNSKKRKATDTMEISSSAQPFKIPHISEGNLEKDKKSSNPLEPQLINLDNENNSNNAKRNEEKKDNNEIREVDEDDVKVYLYSEDELGKEQSFLIQAKEISTKSRPGVRECGPYLLGNVEVYMTEVNGTINIWGKELSQGSTSQNGEELESSTKSKDAKPGFRWQSTPRIFSNQESASTSKKSRILPRFTQEEKQKHCCDVNNTIVECENCSFHSHRLSWPSCNRNVSENQHTCCAPSIRIDEHHCGCEMKHERRSSCGNMCCRSQKFVDSRRISLPDVYHNHSPCCCFNHSHCRSPVQEKLYSHPQLVRRHSFDPTDEEEESEEEENVQHTSKSCNIPKENSPHSCSNTKLVPPRSNTRKNSADNGSDSTPCQNENEPLIAQKGTSDATEGRKRRLSGRKVRGLLMDFLKGCGDCRSSNPLNKTSLRHNPSIYAPSTSAQPRIAYSSNQPCSLRVTENCSCPISNDKAAEIEAQLEFLRVEMEKLRNRTESSREVMDTLRNEDIIN